MLRSLNSGRVIRSALLWSGITFESGVADLAHIQPTLIEFTGSTREVESNYDYEAKQENYETHCERYKCETSGEKGE